MNIIDMKIVVPNIYKKNTKNLMSRSYYYNLLKNPNLLVRVSL